MQEWFAKGNVGLHTIQFWALTQHVESYLMICHLVHITLKEDTAKMLYHRQDIDYIVILH